MAYRKNKIGKGIRNEGKLKLVTSDHKTILLVQKI